MRKNSKSNSNAKFGLLQNKLFQSSLIVFILLIGAGFFLSQSTGLFAKGQAVTYSGTVVLSDDFKYAGQAFFDPATGDVNGWGEYISGSIASTASFPGSGACTVAVTVCGSERFWYDSTGSHSAKTYPTSICFSTLQESGAWSVPSCPVFSAPPGTCGVVRFPNVAWNVNAPRIGLMTVDNVVYNSGGFVPNEPFPVSYASLAYTCI